MRRGDDSVGPRSWYWPTRYKLLIALIIVIVVILLFILRAVTGRRSTI